jgi:hypothetical protein
MPMTTPARFRHRIGAAAAALSLLMAAAPAVAAETGAAPAESGPPGTLSHHLDKSGGVLHPPADVDPQMAKPTPSTPGHSMPVIPPPGTPGGNAKVKPK